MSSHATVSWSGKILDPNRLHQTALPSLVSLALLARPVDNLEMGHVQSFHPQTVELLTAVQKAAVQEWEATEPDATPLLKAFAEVRFARALPDAAASGERDPERLKNAALSESAFVKRSRWPSSPELATSSLERRLPQRLAKGFLRDEPHPIDADAPGLSTTTFAPTAVRSYKSMAS